MLLIDTSRFGQLAVNPDHLIEFAEGILGFPLQHEYALIQSGEGSGFYWLQSVDSRELAFVVCDPRLYVANYHLPVKMEDLECIGLSDPQSGQVFVIVNKVGDLLTGNFQGPLVVNVANRKARQLVLSDKRYATRQPLMRIPARQVMGKQRNVAVASATRLGLQWNDRFQCNGPAGSAFSSPSRSIGAGAIPAYAVLGELQGMVAKRGRARRWNMTHRHGKEGAEYVGAIQTA